LGACKLSPFVFRSSNEADCSSGAGGCSSGLAEDGKSNLDGMMVDSNESARSTHSSCHCSGQVVSSAVWLSIHSDSVCCSVVFGSFCSMAASCSAKVAYCSVRVADCSTVVAAHSIAMVASCTAVMVECCTAVMGACCTVAVVAYYTAAVSFSCFGFGLA
jgi:hypothetical protein